LERLQQGREVGLVYSSFRWDSRLGQRYGLPGYNSLAVRGSARGNRYCAFSYWAGDSGEGDFGEESYLRLDSLFGPGKITASVSRRFYQASCRIERF